MNKKITEKEIKQILKKLSMDPTVWATGDDIADCFNFDLDNELFNRECPTKNEVIAVLQELPEMKRFVKGLMDNFADDFIRSFTDTQIEIEHAKRQEEKDKKQKKQDQENKKLLAENLSAAQRKQIKNLYGIEIGK